MRTIFPLLSGKHPQSPPTGTSVPKSPSLINSDTSAAAQITPSMVSNWIKIYYKPLKRPAFITSMVTHYSAKIPPPGSLMLTTKGVLEGVEKMMKKYLIHGIDEP